MKIILHMGQGKTGTSSLQESLHAASAQLRARGVLYPSFGERYVAHQLLLALCGDPNLLPPWHLESLGGPEAASASARIAWDRTCENIRRNRPELLVLSSEYLLQHVDGPGKERLAKLLMGHSSDITPVVYVRHPVDHYRARLQQFLKFRDGRFPPNNMKLRERILETEAAFERSPELVAFDRKNLHSGDIVCDFATRFLSDWIAPADLPSLNTNVGLSAEALVLMARLRAEAGGTYDATRQVARLVPLLATLDQQDPPSRPFTLLPEVAEAALRVAIGHRWLVETGQLQIPGLDIDRIDGAPSPDWMKAARAETLFFHDPDRLERLQGALEKHTRAGLSIKGQSAPAQETRATARDFLLRFLHRKLGS